MPIELSADLPEILVPVAWLLGRWAGVGVVGYPTMGGDRRFGQEIEFAHDGRDFLSYTSRTWELDDDGATGAPLAAETGYWRPTGPGSDGGTALEVLLVHSTGIVETHYGTVTGPRVELATDLVARTATAKEYSAARRMYGMVDGDLLWVMDMAAVGQPLTSHVSARLKRL